MLTSDMQTPDWLETEVWLLRLQSHHPATLPPTNEKNVKHPATVIPKCVTIIYKNASLKTTEKFQSFEHEGPILPAQPLQ